MRPFLQPSQLVLFKKCRKYKIGQIVAARAGDKEIVKRLLAIGRNKVYLQGDHPDSADYAVSPASLRGRLIFKVSL